MESKSDSLEGCVQNAHIEVLRTKLIQAAKKNKGRLPNWTQSLFICFVQGPTILQSNVCLHSLACMAACCATTALERV